MKALQFIALVLTALALVPSGAHVFALPNKIGLAQEQYFIVPSIYRGWAVFGIVLIGALLADVMLAWKLRGEGAPFWFALVAALCLAQMLAIFFIWTYPANVATNNWTTAPANWQQLRSYWEYSHVINAGVTFASFCSLVLGVLTQRP